MKIQSYQSYQAFAARAEKFWLKEAEPMSGITSELQTRGVPRNLLFLLTEIQPRS